MATVDTLPEQPGLAATRATTAERSEPSKILRQLASVPASLRLTVVLFALATFLVFIGTLAQDKLDMWSAIDQYFRSAIVMVDVKVFFPSSWFPSMTEMPQRVLVALGWLATGVAVAGPLLWRSRGRIGRQLLGIVAGLAAASLAFQSLTLGRFVYPGGATIGVLLAFNLLAAHALRFKIQARGMRLLAGLAVIAVGIAVTWVVIASGHNKEGLQDVPDFSWPVLWLWFKIGLTLLGLGLLAAAAYYYAQGGSRLIEAITLGSAGGLLTFGMAAVWVAGDSAYLGDSGMRILWQLTQSSLAGVILLIGCILTFKRRGGVVLIHAGLALMMFGEGFVSWFVVEERMRISEGQTVNFAMDIRETELAIIDRAYADDTEEVIAVPQSRLVGSGSATGAIQDPELPFDIEVLRYLKNSDLKSPQPGEPNEATAGRGLEALAVAAESSAGADSSGGVDMASAYVRLTEKNGGTPLGTYMVSQWLAEQDQFERVTVDGKTYDVGLRFKRSYKPYSIQLVDFRKDDYIGTDTPRDYSSDVILRDPERGTTREVRIWMNNPLRYAGETFYQSGYERDPQTGGEATVLQVVTNTGWMIPYVSCMLVVIGMLPHFTGSLWRYVRRQQRRGDIADEDVVEAKVLPQRPLADRSGRRRPVAPEPATPKPAWASPAVWIPLATAAILTIWLVGVSISRGPAAGQFDLSGFGQLPVADGGRVKPIDTLARTTLRKISNRDYFRDERGDRQPAIRWFLDMVAQPEEFNRHQVFRIDSLDVLDTLGLKPRKRFRYSLAEISGSGDEPREELATFERHVDEARKKAAKDRDFYDEKVLEVAERFQAFTALSPAFRTFDFPAFPSEEDFQNDREKTTEQLLRIRSLMSAAEEREQMLERMQAPLMVPLAKTTDAADPGRREPAWQAYATACYKAYLNENLKTREVNPATVSLRSLFAAYGENDREAFNAGVARYQAWLAEHSPEEYRPGRVVLESEFNRFDAFGKGTLLYVLAFVLTACAWLGWNKTLNRTALAVLLVAFVLHTIALSGRIYISGRPPVTNLYSSAVFIGWALVVLGIVLEFLFRLGVGNVIAAVAGFVTLLIASSLGAKTDTFTVMQAVLDTQFWLSTHVVCISLGYATTFAAGLLGIIFVLMGFFSRAMDQETRKTLAGMMYGIVCFAIFFSFFGTVLGGLWADDSWGRFWGWDPKENGALMIVLWNAIILHARWGGMVRDRGLALLCIGGNIITSWSWFGVNQLGIGLHSYGFTEGVLITLAAVCGIHLAVIGIGSLPMNLWNSFREHSAKGLAGG